MWLKVHRWLGLTVGLFFVLLGLTGSILVFDHAIDEWLNPDILLTQGQGEKQPVQSIIDAAESAYPGDRKATSATVPRVENGVWTVWFTGGSRGNLVFTAVHVDPYTAEVTGQRVWGEDLMTWIYRLHFRLLAGSVGGIIVGVLGLLILNSLLSGLYLWWPLLKSGIRAAIAIRSGPRFNYDLHKSVGAFSAVFLLVITFTGVYMEFPSVFRDVISKFAATTEGPRRLKSAPSEDQDGITLDEAIEIASQRFPNAKLDHLHPPRREDGVYEVAFRQSDEVQRSYGRTQVFLDRYSGEIVAVRTPETETAADIFFAWQFPLHNGEAFGLFGRWVVFFLGLTPAILYVTGVVIWWRKRTSRKRHQQRHSVVETEVREPVAVG
ncbi:PepSY-associated TM helix domain-containing protein [Thalassoglobus sp. JC818]|uniref:PepSY-associated TM helix domain-containing protein n=1 Tax=Thalassoglobus sp. JC818 TaxID=3232136 RepID=UPI0034584A5F